MIVVGCDPGYRQSAIVAFDGRAILHRELTPNADLLQSMGDYSWPFEKGIATEKPILVIEEMQLFGGFGVGKEIFDSVFWSGQFAHAWSPRKWDRIIRSKVRGHLHASKGGDGAVRAALIARFGPFKEEAIGRKGKRGPLFGIKGDEWSALAIAVVYHDLHAHDPETIRPGVVADF